MTSREFFVQVFFLFLLVSISTGLSLFDKESYFRRSSRDVFRGDITAHIMARDKQGGGNAEGTTETAGRKDAPEPFVQPEQSPTVRPFRNWNIPDPTLSSFSALVQRSSDGRILYQKNIDQPLPIASLTKLMTALVITEYLDPGEIVTVSSRAVATEGEAGNLVVGEQITVGNLLSALLVESSNDAAVALEEYFNVRYPETPLVGVMNRRARELKLFSTVFKNPSGLDEEGMASNVATVSNLALLGTYILDNSPAIMNTIAITSLDITSLDGRYRHHLANSNKLLGTLLEVIGGKTGYTEKAGESLLTFFLAPSFDREVLISVILQSRDRTSDTKVLLNWVKDAYRWE